MLSQVAAIAYITQEPSYLTDAIRFHVRSRHSCNRNLLQKDRTNLVFTDRSFSQAARSVEQSTAACTFPI